MNSRAKIVMATEAINELYRCSFVSPSSSLTTAKSGAIPNQAKKHKKKANHDMWNARICGVLSENRSMLVALFLTSISAHCLELWNGLPRPSST